MSKKINERKILKYFFEEPYKEFHLRELGRLTKYNPSTLSKYLSGYVKERLMIMRYERGYVLYKADVDSEFFRIKKISYNLEKLYKSGIIEFIGAYLNYPRTIVLFGSYAKGEDMKESDIDLIVLTEEKKEIDMDKFEKNLNRKIHLLLYNTEEFKAMKYKNKTLLNNIINGIVIYGYLEVF